MPTIESVLWEERQVQVWDSSGLNSVPYPSWWPQSLIVKGVNSPIFGHVFGFPEINPALSNSFPKYPLFKANNIKAPNIIFFKNLLAVKTLMHDYNIHINTSTSSDSKVIFSQKILEFYNRDGEFWIHWIRDNIPSSLNFWGLSWPSVNVNNSKSPFFVGNLSYTPGQYILMSLLFILNNIHFYYSQTPGSPFLPWLSNTANESESMDIPIAMNNFKAFAKVRATQNLNIWTQTGLLKTQESVFKFLEENKELMKGFIDNIKGKKEGLYLRDKNYDDPLIREEFWKIYYHWDTAHGKWMFQIPDIFGIRKGQPVSVFGLNQYIRYSYFLMEVDLFLLKVNEESTSETPKSEDIDKKKVEETVARVRHVKITPEPPAVSKIEFDMMDFERLRLYWITTAEYAFFNSNQPVWPPRQFESFFPLHPLPHIEKMNNFIMKHPIDRLKVPPIDFFEMKRQDEGWTQVSNLQWRDYLLWVHANVEAQDQPFYSQPFAKLLDKAGKIIPRPDDPHGNTLINSYPDYGVLDPDAKGSATRKGFYKLTVWTLAADFIWGDNFDAWVVGKSQELFKLVIDTLISLKNLVVDVVGDIWPYILGGALILLTAGGVVLGTEKVITSSLK